MFATQMFHGLGIQWAGTLLGCVAIALIPVPVAFHFYGAQLRARSKFAPTLPKPMPAASSDEEEGAQIQHSKEVQP